MREDGPFWLPLVLEGKLVKGTFAFDVDNKLQTRSVQSLDTI